ncbi:D-tyrosyl-tRNA(Tyr) deacylase [Verrucomicrobiaceae bacterium R5-34]|uniref:D-aminoacyl-tRNA deacylase n=1 Tax=Oceaniferula flava TaxID=2800421 RepID=A0AAE2SCG8_9BACT|nr:D-aminoacyl-tRNA deacylase [Oceaniferula flavus]MBK1830385.1 D-tyrosyl-tRNA(Tyr) deacylase [Verrucomicrobiaceae bacterium R5-34]MBK1854477.1 D-tyrosyl-tRNA(Tyr) deacylase [Oceaniferula flavus]MBM1135783.1 D-tyrosyl-tRNA(Tyr) deacylase [Oceaniferula flavus]
MRVVIQRVSEASVSIEGRVAGKIGHGFLILLGIVPEDSQTDIDWLVGKITKMRIFPDDEGKMNRCLTDVDGELLVVSQFTLHAGTKKGNRPSFIKAARPEVAIPLYEQFLATAEKELGKACARGEFGADMQVSLVNDGPVTITMDSHARE